MKGTVKLLRRGSADEQMLERMDVYTRRIEQYVEAMSSIQRLEQMPVQCRPVSLPQLGRELEETARLLAPALNLSCSFPQEGQAELDHGLFLTVAENLVTNAARFARSGLELTMETDGGFLTLTAADDGPGFPQELMQTGPKPFGKRDGDAAHFGMGLYSSQLLCRKHGGDLRLNNCPGATVTASFKFQGKTRECLGMYPLHSPYPKHKESVFMLIKAKKLSKVYGSGENQVVALDKVDLTVAPGDFISIIGPSGSGKSTLLHLLSGLDHPTSGSLTYDGQEIYTLPDKELSAFRRRQMGFIFQQFNLLPVLTARENILMPLLLDKKQPDEGYLSQLAELLGIRNRLDHLPHELSGGQQQRVAIARALIAQPEVIFADEPTGNLDSKSGGEMMDMLKSIRDRMGKTLVIITHDNRIAAMADRRLTIMDGVLSEVAAG